MANDHPPTVVRAEIPVSDMDASIAFYNAVFEYNMTINTEGQNPTAWFPSQDSPSAHGHIYPGKAAAAGHGLTPCIWRSWANWTTPSSAAPTPAAR